MAQALKPFPQFTGVSQAFPNLGTSSYNALQIQATRHLTKGLAILAAYTWSKTIGYSDSALDTEPGIQDVYNRKLERTIASFNYPQNVKLTWIYELPVGPDKALKVSGIWGKIFGGWSLTGNHNVRSGNPLAITSGSISNPLGTAARPDLVLGQPIVTNSEAPIQFRGVAGGETYLNPAAFSNPPVQPGGRNYITRLGTLGYYLPNIRGPMRHSHDVGIQKQYRFRERVSWEPRGTFTNIINRHGRGDPVTDLSNPFFGQITGQQTGGRNLELSTRITF